MKKSNANNKERIARNRFHDATYLGTDGEGDVHFWSMYHQAVVVISDDVETFELSETPLDTLEEWTEHTETKRSAWDELLVADGGILGMVANAIEVAG